MQWTWAMVLFVGVVAAALAVARARVRHQEIENAARADVGVSVSSRLAGHGLASTSGGGNPRDDDGLADQITAVLRAEPHVHTKTALAKRTGRNARALQLIKAMQDDGRVVPNVRGAKLALAEEHEQSGPSASAW